MVIDREQAMRQLAEHEISQLSDEQKLNLVLDYWYLFEDFDLSHKLKFFLANHEAESLTEYTDFFRPIALIGLEDKCKIFNNKYLTEELKRYTQNEFQVSGNEKQTLSPCPCCSFYSLSPPTDYAVCPICQWENDGTAGEQYSAINRGTLSCYRENFLEKHSKSALQTKYIL